MNLTSENFVEFVTVISKRLQQYDDAERIWETANTINDELGGTALNVAVTLGNGGGIAWARSSMSDEWLGRYEEAGYSAIDPFVHSLLAGEPEVMVDCGTLDPSDPAYRLNHDLKAYGYGSLFATAWSSPTNDARAMIVYCASDRLADVEIRIGLDRLRIIHAIFASHMSVPGDLSKKGFLNVGTAPLTPRERDILSLLARGLRNDQIAFKAQIAEVTVRKHLTVIRSKLQASTREQAIAIAVKQGLITP
ncbi:helix-turn-helix transcriptional regulator [Sulfitobacter noctilucicola]|uniref:DNA-binding CsgD family transcriptional regulator n=1 Tax=Sulfitobacter noctilucicola TaxID=1342301 RepID=A0A7W6M5X2_9RHOB|nr:LuxR family transcriptional regulator [Sulfitobacter noctilucicola]MBB4173068.1 DNA-binding CsgD family transcriptional regulator [Sulfitobacter noctilucicola]